MNRRDFLKDTLISTMSAAMGMTAVELRAEPAQDDDRQKGAPVSTAVIGLGPQGREILASLAKIQNAPVSAICDTYTAAGFVKRAQDIAPSAKFGSDYKAILDDKTIAAVFVATPSHLHKQIALDAIASGKHVYCEAPIATDLVESKAICSAGAAAKTVFMAGLQMRANKQNQHVLGFVRAGDLGRVAEARGQWHAKGSWRQVAPTPEREHDINWRLTKQTSSGLMGEIAIHQIDLANWYFKATPVAVTGFGSIMQWAQDGMDVPDTVQAIVEYPGNVKYAYDATLANSFDGAYDVYMGSDSAILLRDQRAWMFKEVDAPLFGWEVYARKDKLTIGDASTGTGIALVADATKLIAQGKQPGDVGTDVTKTSLYQAVEEFIWCARTGNHPGADAIAGHTGTVVSRKAHEASLSNSRIEFQKEWFELS